MAGFRTSLRLVLVVVGLLSALPPPLHRVAAACLAAKLWFVVGAERSTTRADQAFWQLGQSSGNSLL